MRDIWNNPLSPIYRKKGEEVPAQLAQASWLALTRRHRLLLEHPGRPKWA